MPKRFIVLALVLTMTFSTNLYAGWFDSDNTIHVIEKDNSNPLKQKYAVTIRIAGYVDERIGFPPKQIGITTEKVFGISGKELLLDREVTEIVGNSIAKRLEKEGFQLVDSNALYELSGVVKELSYNVKARDEINILLATSLKEVATGKVIWSGVVAQRNERFAGVSGNSKGDIAISLRHELGIVTQKTVNEIRPLLMTSRPELFINALATQSENLVLGGSASSVAAPPVQTEPKVATNGNGGLSVVIKPPRSKVYLDGVYFGLSPLRAEVEVGIHEVSVKSDGYKTATEKVSIRKGDTTELELVLEH